jgi:hypothetical protein
LLPFFDEIKPHLHRHGEVERAFHAHFDNLFPVHTLSRRFKTNKFAAPHLISCKARIVPREIFHNLFILLVIFLQDQKLLCLRVENYLIRQELFFWRRLAGVWQQAGSCARDVRGGFGAGRTLGLPQNEGFLS